MRIKAEGLKPMEKFFIFAMVSLAIAMTGFLYGRLVERRCWEQAQAEVSQEHETLILLEKVIKLESGGRHDVWGQDNEFGLAQFKQATFFFLAEKMGLENPDWQSWEHQVLILNWAIRNGYAERHWSTYERAKGK